MHMDVNEQPTNIKQSFLSYTTSAGLLSLPLFQVKDNVFSTKYLYLYNSLSYTLCILRFFVTNRHDYFQTIDNIAC